MVDAFDDTEDPSIQFGLNLVSVVTPTGSSINVQTQEEADWFEDKKKLYMSHNKFENVSDLQDLDRLLVLEVMIFRWGQWMTQGFDYQYTLVDQQALKNNLKEWSVEVRLLKQSLGIDRATRDKDKGEDIAQYVENLLKRAKEFGYHRNRQYELAVTKIWELKSLVETFDRCDDEERADLDLSHESIMEWIRSKLIADWNKLDEDFRKHQKMWIRTL